MYIWILPPMYRVHLQGTQYKSTLCHRPTIRYTPISRHRACLRAPWWKTKRFLQAGHVYITFKDHSLKIVHRKCHKTLLTGSNGSLFIPPTKANRLQLRSRGRTINVRCCSSTATCFDASAFLCLFSKHSTKNRVIHTEHPDRWGP
jgi:hypothetical protein